jgi:hypothetical protein
VQLLERTEHRRRVGLDRELRRHDQLERAEHAAHAELGDAGRQVGFAQIELGRAEHRDGGQHARRGPGAALVDRAEHRGDPAARRPTVDGRRRPRRERGRGRGQVGDQRVERGHALGALGQLEPALQLVDLQRVVAELLRQDRDDLIAPGADGDQRGGRGGHGGRIPRGHAGASARQRAAASASSRARSTPSSSAISRSRW